MLQPIPKSIDYSYYIIDRYPTDFNMPIYYNVSTQINSNNIQLNSIPRRIYLFARISNSVNLQNSASTDTFASIQSISINYNNNSGLLASATQFDLYNISKKNGVNLSWPEWSGGQYPNTGSNTNSGQVGTFQSIVTTAHPDGFSQTPLVGSVLCLEFGTDIGLPDTNAPGQILNSQLQITVNIVNTNPKAAMSLTPPTTLTTYTLYIVTISEGIWQITNLNSIPMIGVLSKEDILNATQIPGINYTAQDSVAGGDFKHRLKKIGHRIYEGIKSAAPIALDIAKIAAQVAPYVLPLIGLGDDEMMEQGGVLIGAGRKKKGGAIMKRNELRKRMQY